MVKVCFINRKWKKSHISSIYIWINKLDTSNITVKTPKGIRRKLMGTGPARNVVIFTL